MTRKKLLMLLGSVCLALMLVVPLVAACATPAPTPTPTLTPTPEQQVIEWQGTHYMPPSGPIWEAALEIGEVVEGLTEGGFTIEFLPAESVIETVEMAAGIRDRIIECGMAWGGYNIDIYPETVFGGYAPYCFQTMSDALIYFDERGALALLNEGCREYGIYTVAMMAAGRHHPLVSEKPIPDIKALQGMKVRSAGMILDAQVESVGASPVFVPLGEAYTLVAAGTVDAVCGVGVSDLYDMGFADIAKYWLVYPYMLPGWLDTFVVNPSAWEELPDSYEVALKTAIDAVSIRLMVRQDAAEIDTLRKLRSEGITLVSWPEEEQDTFSKIVLPAIKEMYKSTPRTDKLYEILTELLTELYG